MRQEFILYIYDQISVNFFSNCITITIITLISIIILIIINTLITIVFNDLYSCKHSKNDAYHSFNLAASTGHS